MNTYYFKGPDTLDRFGYFATLGTFAFLIGGPLHLPRHLASIHPYLPELVLAAAILLGLGLQRSISVDHRGVRVTLWVYFIPYRTYSAESIESVWYGGDWGEREGASCITVDFAGRSVHLGSGKSMDQLYKDLQAFAERPWPPS